MPKWAIALILLVLSSSTGRAQVSSSWKTFASAPGGFSVRLPGTPMEDAPKEAAPSASTNHSYTLSIKDTVYILTYTDVAKETVAKSTPKALLNAARDGGIKNVNGKLIAETEVKVNGYPGRDVTASVSIDKNPGSMRFRIVLADARLYMALFVGPGRSATGAQIDEFLKSFKIVAPPTAADKWQTFTSEAGGFTVRVPRKPTEETEDIEGRGKVHRFTVDNGPLGYIVSYNSLPAGAPSASSVPDLLNKGRDTVVSGLKGKLLAEKSISLAGNSGRALHIAIPDKAGAVYMRCYIAGDRYYQLMVIGESKALDFARDQRFLESFQFVPSAPASPWAAYTSTEGRFSIDMPGTPKQEMLPNDTTKYSVEFGGTVYIVVTVDLKDATDDPDKITAVLEAAKDAEMKVLDAKSLSQRRVMLGAASGLQVNLSIPEAKISGGGLGIERFYLVGKRLYEVAIISGDKSTSESAFDRFFDTFKVTSPQPCNLQGPTSVLLETR